MYYINWRYAIYKILTSYNMIWNRFLKYPLIKDSYWFGLFDNHFESNWSNLESNTALEAMAFSCNYQSSTSELFISERVCCHNARGRGQNRKSYCSFMIGWIVTTKPNRSVLIAIKTWHFLYHSANVGIRYLKGELIYCSKRGRFRVLIPRATHYVTWCPLTTGIITSQCQSLRDAVLVTRWHL